MEILQFSDVFHMFLQLSRPSTQYTAKVVRPDCLNQLLNLMSLDRRSLACNLFIPTMLLSTVGDRVFQSTSVSPSLPAFKRELKTVLFTRSCSDSFACACQFYFAMTLISFVFLCSVLAIFRLPPSSLIPTICKRVFNCKYVSCKICFNVLYTG